MLGANPFHLSHMRYLGDRWAALSQMPNVEGMTLLFMGFTSAGRPYYNPYGMSASLEHRRLHRFPC